MCEYKKWHERIDCDFKNVDLSYFICCPLKWYRFCSYISISLFVLIAFLVFNFTILNQNSNWRKKISIKLKNCQIEKSSNWRVIMIAPMKMVLHHRCNYDSEFHFNYKFTSALVQLSRFVANIWRSLSLVYWMMDALSDLSSNTAPGRTKRKKKLRKFSRKFDNFDQSTIIFQMSSQLHDYVFISK